MSKLQTSLFNSYLSNAGEKGSPHFSVYLSQAFNFPFFFWSDAKFHRNIDDIEEQCSFDILDQCASATVVFLWSMGRVSLLQLIWDFVEETPLEKLSRFGTFRCHYWANAITFWISLALTSLLLRGIVMTNGPPFYVHIYEPLYRTFQRLLRLATVSTQIIKLEYGHVKILAVLPYLWYSNECISSKLASYPSRCQISNLYSIYLLR